MTLQGDARRLPLDDESIDLVVTSPPYLNAIDYMRCSKFSLVWMGYTIESLRHIRSASIGTEVSLQKEETDECVRTIVSDLNLQPKLNDRGQSPVKLHREARPTQPITAPAPLLRQHRNAIRQERMHGAFQCPQSKVRLIHR